MNRETKTLLFCELEVNGDRGSWLNYQQWLGEAHRYGLRVEQARMQPDLTTQLENADALFLCSEDLLCTSTERELISKLIRGGKRTFGIAAFSGAQDDPTASFWADLGIEVTNRGIFPLDGTPSHDHPQCLYLREEDQTNALAQALLSGAADQEFSRADRLFCSEDWSPAFELRKENYCDYLRGEDRFDFFSGTENPYFAASRCFVGDEPTTLVSSNAFMMNGFTSIGGYPTSGYREHRTMGNQLLKWLAGDLSAKESRTDRIRSLWFRFEELLHREIREIMTESFGSDWIEKSLPDSLSEKIKETEARNRNAPPDSHFHFVDYATIIRHQWELFSSHWAWLSETSKGQLKKDFGSLNKHVRTPAAHPARLGDSQIPEESEQLLERYFSKFRELQRPQ